jgi:hypothetical protein
MRRPHRHLIELVNPLRDNFGWPLLGRAAARYRLIA